MAYSELIKDFGRIRDYMRQFYVYGFKSREEYSGKSARSYDNERRRIDSWLGEYMAFRQDAAGKSVFLSVDSRQIPRNPLHKAFKAKSFTSRDITLHFCLLDLLAGGEALSVHEIVDRLHSEYLSRAREGFELDESTVRKKLKEYDALGLLHGEKRGREVFYRRTDDSPFPLRSWLDALAFFSETAPAGVIGSFLLDKLDESSDVFRFKHHYILHTLDSDILTRLLLAMNEERSVTLTVRNLRTGFDYRRTVCPLKIYSSTQTGRQYLLGWYSRSRRMAFYRLDAIRKAEPGAREEHYRQYQEEQARFDQHLWGVSVSPGRSLEHIELTVRFGPGEEFILQRLAREKRHGTLETLDAHTCRFTASVYDAMEMLPWLRTFIGRIVDLKCSNPLVTNTFYEDLRRMRGLYGGGGDDLS